MPYEPRLCSLSFVQQKGANGGAYQAEEEGA
jgi:hypothetical protein